MTWTADRRLVTRDGRVLAADEEQNGVLLAAEGGEVSDADCKRYGLGPHAPQETPAPSRPRSSAQGRA